MIIWQCSYRDVEAYYYTDIIVRWFLGIPIKLLVVDDYKGYGRRYFFSTNVNDAAEDIITTWEK